MISIKEVIYRIYANPIMRNMERSDVVTSIKTILRLIGVPGSLTQKSIVLEILEGRATLPKDLMNIVSVVLQDTNGNAIRVRASTDDNIQVNHTKADTQIPAITYQRAHDYLYTDFQEGTVRVVYNGIAMDKDGYPEIPDNESLLMAIENYVKFRYFTGLFENGFIGEGVLDRAETQYLFYVGQVSNDFDMPSEDGIESLINSIATLIPNRDAIDSNFKFQGIPQHLKAH